MELIAYLAATILAAFAGDKAKSIHRFIRRKRSYENALRMHKVVINSLTEHAKEKEKSVNRVILGDMDIVNQERLKDIYTLVAKHDELKRYELDQPADMTNDFRLLEEYLNIVSPDKRAHKVALALNSGLISSLLQNFLSATDRSAINRSTVVGMLVGKKMKEDTKSYVYFLCALLLQGALTLAGVIELNAYLLGFLVLMVSALAINQKALEYRIKRGLYGSTPYEVREIIKFIDEHADKNDFNDQGGARKIFQDAMEETPKEIIVHGGAYQ